ncbi:MAG: site-specific DNA-methyltransferase [Oscillospiraceae bacterium]|nr:site-specific DNA-methyltransferase [Oscillospiraceae bacterium]
MDNEKLDGLSLDIEQTERDKLRAVFPECFVEGKLNIDKLLTMCGEYITDDFEKYEFKWKGKSECLQLAQKRSTGTLRPCPEETESVNFDTTKNIYIEGDNLEVLKLLQTSYYRKIKMIYIDPPYNTGSDFVYKDDFADPMARYKEITSQTTKSNPETMGRYHTNWLNMMYPRLRLAANLLRDDGVIFISIDDNEVHNLRKLCDEVFGEENFLGNITWIKKTKPINSGNAKFQLQSKIEYILVYCKGKNANDTYVFHLQKQGEHTYSYQGKFGLCRLKDIEDSDYGTKNRETMKFPILGVYPDNGKRWKIGQDEILKLIDKERVQIIDGKVKILIYPEDESGEILKPFWSHLENVGTAEAGKKLLTDVMNINVGFDTVKPMELIKELISSMSSNNDIILDFFSGSATTAHAVMQLNAEDGGNRRFIMVQLPEVCDENHEAFKAGYKNICEIGKERIRRAGTKILNEATEETVDIARYGEGYEVDNIVHKYKNLDTGFRVFKLDDSNLKIWDNTPITGENALSELERRLRGMLDIIKDDRSNLDVVYEVMLKLGQDLCEDIRELDINGKIVYGVGTDVDFIVCLAEHITPEDAEVMAGYKPGRIIFSEQCFDDTTDKSNVKLTLRDRNVGIKML